MHDSPMQVATPLATAERRSRSRMPSGASPGAWNGRPLGAPPATLVSVCCFLSSRSVPMPGAHRAPTVPPLCCKRSIASVPIQTAVTNQASGVSTQQRIAPAGILITPYISARQAPLVDRWAEGRRQTARDLNIPPLAAQRALVGRCIDEH